MLKFDTQAATTYAAALLVTVVSTAMLFAVTAVPAVTVAAGSIA